MDRIFLPRPVSRFIARLVAASHAKAAEASRAVALLAGRPTVGFEDVQIVAAAVLNHRLILNYKARLDQVDPFTLVRQLVESLDATGLDLPADVRLQENRDA